jgi:hypothetical protein
MKTLILSIILISSTFTFNVVDKLPAYYKVASVSESMENAAAKVKAALQSEKFEIVGEYNPGSKEGLRVLCFTREDLKSTATKVSDHGALAAVLKVGLVKKGNNIDISYLNPEYLFNAYLRDEYAKNSTSLKKIEGDVKHAMSTLGNLLTPFGGMESADDLHDYHYMIGMPYFSDPVSLKKFSNFQEGLKTIRKNLDDKKGNTVSVYEMTWPDKNIAVFGVGLLDTNTGEAHFLPIIGEDNIAAMPYEIILQGNEATMLHGRYRFALHWPELTMGTFTKIMSTPKEVKETLEGLTL